MFKFLKKEDKTQQVKREQQAQIDVSALPTHIAIIMDGNGRWAKQRMLSRSIGHREGSKNVKRIVKYCGDLGVSYMTLYAFSTENWSRPKEEVDLLMDLLLEFLRNAESELDGADVRIHVIGDRSALNDAINAEIDRVEKVTENNKSLWLNIAINYGGRHELNSAVVEIAKKVSDGVMSCDEIDEKCISDHLYTAGMPEPDLIIRTSGEARLSNFLMWQSAYSEFYFTDVLWPDFNEEEMKTAIVEFQKRNRKFGGVKEEGK